MASTTSDTDDTSSKQQQAQCKENYNKSKRPVSSVDHCHPYLCVCVVPMMGLGGTVTLRYHVDVITDSQSLQYLYFVQPLGGRAFSRSSSVLFLLHHDSSHFTCMPASWSPSTLQPHDVTDTSSSCAHWCSCMCTINIWEREREREREREGGREGGWEGELVVDALSM